jgi:hypothetical protein
MVIFIEKSPKREAGSDSEWDITWKDALGVFKLLLRRNDIRFFEVGPDRSPLGSNQSKVGIRASANNNDLFIHGKQTGYIIFGSQVKRIIRRHYESSGVEEMVFLFSPYKELVLRWKG